MCAGRASGGRSKALRALEDHGQHFAKKFGRLRRRFRYFGKAAAGEGGSTMSESVARQLWSCARNGDAAAYERLFTLQIEPLLV